MVELPVAVVFAVGRGVARLLFGHVEPVATQFGVMFELLSGKAVQFTANPEECADRNLDIAGLA